MKKLVLALIVGALVAPQAALASAKVQLPVYAFAFSSAASCEQNPCELVVTPHGIGPTATVLTVGPEVACAGTYVYWHWRDGLSNCESAPFGYSAHGAIAVDPVSGPWVWDVYARQYLPGFGYELSNMRTVTIPSTSYPVYFGMFAVGYEGAS